MIFIILIQAAGNSQEWNQILLTIKYVTRLRIIWNFKAVVGNGVNNLVASKGRNANGTWVAHHFPEEINDMFNVIQRTVLAYDLDAAELFQVKNVNLKKKKIDILTHKTSKFPF